MQFHVKGSIKRHFELFNANETSLGQLNYEHWISNKCMIKLHNDATYSIASSGMWQSKLEVKQDNTVIGQFKFNWNGQIVIEMDHNHYIFQRTGFFGGQYSLKNEQNIELFHIKANFDFTSFSFNFTIETNDQYAEKDNVILMLTAIYCVNHMNAMHGGNV